MFLNKKHFIFFLRQLQKQQNEDLTVSFHVINDNSNNQQVIWYQLMLDMALLAMSSTRNIDQREWKRSMKKQKEQQRQQR